jgi:dipeptidyl aminopeptidase/acylaminoacyl peptidase
MLRIFLSGLMTFTAFLIFGQNSMNPELLMKLGRVGLDDVSPNGEHILYGVTTMDMEANSSERYIFRMPVSGGEPESFGQEGISGVHYVQGTDLIAYTKKGQVYVQTWAGAPRQLTNIEGGISNARVYANDKALRVVFSKKMERAHWPARAYDALPKANIRVFDNLMYRHWDRWQQREVGHLGTLRIEANESAATKWENLSEKLDFADFDFPRPPFGGSGDFDVSPDGSMLAFVMKPYAGKDFATKTNSDIYLYDFSSGKVTNLSTDRPGYDLSPKFSPSGKYVFWMSMPRAGFEADVSNIMVYDVKSGRTHALRADYWHSFDWENGDDQTLVVTKDEKATLPIYRLNLRLRARGADIRSEELVVGGRYNFGKLKRAGKFIVAERQDMNHATEIFRIDAKGEQTPLTRVNTPLYERLDLSEIREEWVTTTDGKKMLVWLILPPNFDPNKKYPALLYCQGGPQSAVSQFYSFRWNFQLMASAGFVVIAPNRRGLPGFGQEWNDEISGDWGGQSIRDYLTATDSMAALPFIDENRIGAVGASYGGYSVYQLAGVHNKRFKTFISHCGLFHMESWYGTTEELFFADWDLGGPYWKNPRPESYDAFSPHKHVSKWDTPILVIHGELDFRVPVEQGLQAYQAAQLMGIDSRLLLFPDEGHWVLKPQNAMVWQTEFFTWLGKHLMK